MAGEHFTSEPAKVEWYAEQGKTVPERVGVKEAYRHSQRKASEVAEEKARKNEEALTKAAMQTASQMNLPTERTGNEKPIGEIIRDIESRGGGFFVE